MKKSKIEKGSGRMSEKEQQFIQAQNLIEKVKQEIGRFIVGQEEVVEQVLWSIFSGGHVLLEGLPGLKGKNDACSHDFGKFGPGFFKDSIYTRFNASRYYRDNAA